MYAVIKTGGKQYRIQEGDVIDVELLNDVVGNSIEFNQVLFLNDGHAMKVGTPHLSCTVKAEILGEVKGPKVIAYKYKRRKRACTTIGHRQKYSRVKIVKIEK
ncbi:MAG: 50S ribosomal protein L21 [Chlamydiae bacterium]|jgi:large subunit ribosomal protein L21|nr:50S ribosomal protein L21 [Chlamydiota bacterium]